MQANTSNIVAIAAYVQANTATIIGQAAYVQANTATIIAQAAYGRANSEIIGTAAYVQANTATNIGQAAYVQANTSNTVAIAAYVQANTSNTVAIAAYAQANTATIIAQAAYAQANTSYVSIITNNFTAAGSNTFILSIPPLSSNNIIVNLDGITQLKSAYTLVGTNLSLSEIPSPGSSIDVTIFSNGSLDSAVAAIYQSGTPGQALVANTNNSIVWHNRVTKTANTTAPTDAVEGDTWLDTSTGIWSMYLVQGSGVTGNGWVEFGRT